MSPCLLLGKYTAIKHMPALSSRDCARYPALMLDLFVFSSCVLCDVFLQVRLFDLRADAQLGRLDDSQTIFPCNSLSFSFSSKHVYGFFVLVGQTCAVASKNVPSVNAILDGS